MATRAAGRGVPESGCAPHRAPGYSLRLSLRPPDSSTVTIIAALGAGVGRATAGGGWGRSRDHPCETERVPGQARDGGLDAHLVGHGRAAGSRTAVVEVLDPDRCDCARSGWSAARISAVWCGRSVRLATRSGCARIDSVE